ncbi:hypothetical protein MRX96_025033 [Rhipicephalus microplus]
MGLQTSTLIVNRLLSLLQLALEVDQEVALVVSSYIKGQCSDRDELRRTMVAYRWIRPGSADACANRFSPSHLVAAVALGVGRRCCGRGSTRRHDPGRLWAGAETHVRLDLVHSRRTTVFYRRWHSTVVDSRWTLVCSLFEPCLLMLYCSSDAGIACDLLASRSFLRLALRTSSVAKARA